MIATTLHHGSEAKASPPQGSGNEADDATVEQERQQEQAPLGQADDGSRAGKWPL